MMLQRCGPPQLQQRCPAPVSQLAHKQHRLFSRAACAACRRFSYLPCHASGKSQRMNGWHTGRVMSGASSSCDRKSLRSDSIQLRLTANNCSHPHPLVLQDTCLCMHLQGVLHAGHVQHTNGNLRRRSSAGSVCKAAETFELGTVYLDGKKANWLAPKVRASSILATWTYCMHAAHGSGPVLRLAATAAVSAPTSGMGVSHVHVLHPCRFHRTFHCSCSCSTQ
jgi:hypothetical protein